VLCSLNATRLFTVLRDVRVLVAPPA
jgi:hypothetical protein